MPGSGRKRVRLSNNLKNNADEFKCIEDHCRIAHRFMSYEEFIDHLTVCSSSSQETTDKKPDLDSAYGTETSDSQDDCEPDRLGPETPDGMPAALMVRLGKGSSKPEPAPETDRLGPEPPDSMPAAWMVRLHQPEPAPETIFPRSDTVKACVNQGRGCPKRGVYNQLVYHQKICSYPAYTSRLADRTRRHRCTGYLSRQLAKPRFISFNNSFLKEIGAQFFFTEKNNKMFFHAYSGNLRYQGTKYTLKLKFPGFPFCMRAPLDGTEKVLVIPEHLREANLVIKYSIKISYDDPPILID